MIKKLLLACVLCANSANGFEQFDTFFNNLKSFQADFNQSVYSDNGDFISQTTGQVAFQRPQQLRWHTHTPSEQILLLKDVDLWLIDNELEQAVLQKNQNLANTALHWLIREPNGKSGAKYSHSASGIDWYVANKNASQPISFGFTGGNLSAISLQNELEQTIYINFTNSKINSKIAPKTFELNLGADFNIIR